MTYQTSAPLSPNAPRESERQAVDPSAVEAFVDSFLRDARGAFCILGAILGRRLGLYAILEVAGPLDASALALRAGIDARYAREWLEQQTVAGIVEVEDAKAPADERRFFLPPAHAEALTNELSLDYVAPLLGMLGGSLRVFNDLPSAYQKGEGIPYARYGSEFVAAQGAMNRPMFERLLASEWLPTMEDVHATLQREGAHIADVGCGTGWSSIAMARAYPQVQVDGFDPDVASVDVAKDNADATALANRVHFYAVDAAQATGPGQYDLVTAFECIHDLADPVAVLSSIRRLAKPDGTVFIMDERVSDAFGESGKEMDWMMYGWSILHCLPVGRAESPSRATGTVMRADTLQQYVKEAGFSTFEVLDIANPFFRFYRLTP